MQDAVGVDCVNLLKGFTLRHPDLRRLEVGETKFGIFVLPRRTVVVQCEVSKRDPGWAFKKLNLPYILSELTLPEFLRATQQPWLYIESLVLGGQWQFTEAELFEASVSCSRSLS